jgi:hypothetical protein
MPSWSRNATILLVGAVLLVLVASGCSSGRVGIHGTVSYKGSPVVMGKIQFLPKDKESGTPEMAVITDGNYAFAADKGLLPGSYRVEITAPDIKGPRPAATAAPGAPRRDKELLPEQYNTQSTLSIEVTATGNREFNFPLD